MLSYSGLHSRGIGFLDVDCSAEDDPENNHSECALYNEASRSYFLQLPSRTRSEDDILIDPQIPFALHCLPWLLEQSLIMSRQHGFTREQTPLLELRKSQIATHALDALHAAMVIPKLEVWCSYVGLRHEDDLKAVQRNHVWLGGCVLDRTLTLDCLPFLRSVANHEDVVQLNMATMPEEEDTTRSARRTRANKRNRRRHYLEEISEGDRTIESKALELANRLVGIP